MDPLSLAASVIAVATVAAQTCKAFLRLRALHKAIPGRLHALNNEAVDVEIVLYQVATVIRERESLASTIPSIDNEQEHIKHLLKQAYSKLNELKAIVNRLCDSCANSKPFDFRGYKWQKEQDRLQALQNDIKSIKCNLNIILDETWSEFV
ncbi:hypothetical protein MMC20_003681 [Loxospora ochrophaea]|nr:hypothetical protein [Loxospora ochrophaea]